MSNDVLDDRILPLVEACAPLRVAVKLKRSKDRYYIDFDGSKTYGDTDDWDKYWVGFEMYVKHILHENGFDHSSIKMKSKHHAVAFVGTLFGFLIHERKSDD